MDQPIPDITLSDIERVIKRDYPEEKREQVMQIIMEYSNDMPDSENYRIRMAALRLANGNMEALAIQIRYAKMDYRDILLQAEYPLCAKKMFKKLAEKETEEIYRKDWEQYQIWLMKE